MMEAICYDVFFYSSGKCEVKQIEEDWLYTGNPGIEFYTFSHMTNKIEKVRVTVSVSNKEYAIGRAVFLLLEVIEDRIAYSARDKAREEFYRNLTGRIPLTPYDGLSRRAV
jgi:hypothetical protein